MTAEELLHPRYKVVADMPFNHFSVGDIIADVNKIEGYRLEKYPHLFKRLAWWEDRDEREMPSYIKNNNGRVYKVAKHFNDETKSACDIEDSDGYGRYYFAYLPATKEEYESALKEIT